MNIVIFHQKYVNTVMGNGFVLFLMNYFFKIFFPFFICSEFNELINTEFFVF